MNKLFEFLVLTAAEACRARLQLLPWSAEQEPGSGCPVFQSFALSSYIVAFESKTKKTALGISVEGIILAHVSLPISRSLLSCLQEYTILSHSSFENRAWMSFSVHPCSLPIVAKVSLNSGIASL